MFGIKKGWVDWNEYEQKVDCIDLNNFQQDTRRANLRN